MVAILQFCGRNDTISLPQTRKSKLNAPNSSQNSGPIAHVLNTCLLCTGLFTCLSFLTSIDGDHAIPCLSGWPAPGEECKWNMSRVGGGILFLGWQHSLVLQRPRSLVGFTYRLAYGSHQVPCCPATFAPDAPCSLLEGMPPLQKGVISRETEDRW